MATTAETAILCAVEGCGRPVDDVRWCHAHYERQRRGDSLGGPIADTPEKRFWVRVQKSDDADGCWLWTGAKGGVGYGRFAGMQAHQWSYEQAGGVVPDGYELDHLCRVTLCVRPDHLEPVDHRTNVLRGQGIAAVNARKTHCKRGHEFTPENTRAMKNGGRACRECARGYYFRDVADGRRTRKFARADLDEFCMNGHLRAEAGFFILKNGSRLCKSCHAASQRRYRDRLAS